MNLKSFIWLLAVFGLCRACFQIDSGSVQVQQCDDTTGELVCTYNTVTSLVLPIQTGNCGQLQLIGGSYDNSVIFPDGQVTFTIDILDTYLRVELDGVGLCADVTSVVDIRCNCINAVQGCWDYDGLDPVCKATNHCPNYGVPAGFAQTSFCFQAVGGDSSSCVSNDPFWCGCAYDAQNGAYYWFANIASYVPYATMRLTVNDSREIFVSQDVTFVLQGLNTYQLSVAKYSIGFSTEVFNLPDPALASQGLFVVNREDIVPYVIPGIAPLGAVAQATTACYYRSVDNGNSWVYDQTSFNEALECGTSQTKVCKTNKANCQLNTGKLQPSLIAENAVAQRVSSFYKYRDYTVGASSFFRLNLAQELSLSVQVTSTAASVRSIVSYAVATLDQVGSHSICTFGTKSIWAHGHNSADSGQGFGVLIDSNVSYTLGNVDVPSGTFNLSWPMPVFDDNMQFCLYTSIISCLYFSPTCEAEVIPQNPSTANNGDGTSSAVGSWWVILLIVVAALIGLACCLFLCACFISRI